MPKAFSRPSHPCALACGETPEPGGEGARTPVSHLDDYESSRISSQDINLVVAHPNVAFDKSPPELTDVLNDELLCKCANLQTSSTSPSHSATIGRSPIAVANLLRKVRLLRNYGPALVARV